MFTTVIAVYCLLVRIFSMKSSKLELKKKHIGLRVKNQNCFAVTSFLFRNKTNIDANGIYRPNLH